MQDQLESPLRIRFSHLKKHLDSPRLFEMYLNGFIQEAKQTSYLICGNIVNDYFLIPDQYKLYKSLSLVDPTSGATVILPTENTKGRILLDAILEGVSIEEATEIAEYKRKSDAIKVYDEYAGAIELYLQKKNASDSGDIYVDQSTLDMAHKMIHVLEGHDLWMDALSRKGESEKYIEADELTSDIEFLFPVRGTIDRINMEFKHDVWYVDIYDLKTTSENVTEQTIKKRKYHWQVIWYGQIIKQIMAEKGMDCVVNLYIMMANEYESALFTINEGRYINEFQKFLDNVTNTINFGTRNKVVTI